MKGGTAAYRYAKARYDLDVVVDQWMDVFNQSKKKEGK